VKVANKGQARAAAFYLPTFFFFFFSPFSIFRLGFRGGRESARRGSSQSPFFFFFSLPPSLPFTPGFSSFYLCDQGGNRSRAGERVSPTVISPLFFPLFFSLSPLSFASYLLLSEFFFFRSAW